MFCFLLLFCITSCSNNTFAQRNRKAEKETPEQILNISPPAAAPAIPAKADTTLPVEKENRKDKNKSFNVSLLLPLFLNEVKQTETDSIPVFHHNNSTNQGIHLYEGIRFALDSLSHRGISFRINILDTRQDEETVKTIVAAPEFYNADLIIGPVYNSSMKIAADYAKKYNIPIVAPLSPAESITADNPYFFQPNPGIGVHCKTIYDYATTHYPKENLLLIHQDADKEVWEHFKPLTGAASCRDLLFTGGKFVDVTGKNPATDLKSYLKTNASNVIMVASFDLQFAHKLSRLLFNLSEDYTFVIIGLPVWNPENDLRLDYLEKLNTHFTLASYITDTLFFNSAFARRFNDTFGHFPNETNYKGFDMGYYFGSLLATHGKDFYKKFPDLPDTLNHTVFNFQKKYTEGSFSNETRFLYFENTHVFLFRYDNYTLKKLK
jgi:hypothetical protein